MESEVTQGRGWPGAFRVKAVLVLVVVGTAICIAGRAGDGRDPALTIPYCPKPPVIDGKLAEGEWEFAAAVSMFEAYSRPVSRVMRMEQPTFYVCWDSDNLYVAMDSLESPVNRVMAQCVQNDHMRVIGDDCMELMVCPGDSEAIKDPDFPTYYFAVNSIGTLWDAMFKPLRAERYNSWQSGAEIAHGVDGTRWNCEMRVPLASIAGERPVDGTMWRMNFDRTYHGYYWSAWNASGGLNDPRVGGDVTFATSCPSVRLVSVEELIAASLKIVMEVANATETAQDVTLSITATGYDEKGEEPVSVGTDEKTVAVAPGTKQEIALGGGQRLRRYNTITLAATDAAGKRLFFLQRDVQIPVPRIAVRPAPELSLVYVFPRFLPSLERLAVEVDVTAWLRKMGAEDGAFQTEVTVCPKDSPGKPVIRWTCDGFKRGKGVWRPSATDQPKGKYSVPVRVTGSGKAVWRASTRDLPEGEYTVRVRVSESGKELIVHDDWFEKRIFDWMVHKRGLTEEAPAPYTALEVDGASVRPWGREYRFAPTGLPGAVVSQSKPLLSGPVTLQAIVNGKPAKAEVKHPFKVRDAKPVEVCGESLLSLRGMAVFLVSSTEFDGLTIFRLTYAPADKPVTLNRMRLRIPLTGKYCRFYSASGDKEGTNIQGAVLPDAQGKFYDSKEHTYAVGGYPTFSTLLWIGDYDSYFCYAADNPKGWVVRDDAPAVEASREGDEVVVWLNLVNDDVKLAFARTLEFAFQTGPTKPLPKGWRGIQFDGDPGAVPTTVSRPPLAGGGLTLYGGPNVIHPGLTPDVVEKSRERIAEYASSGPYKVVGYHRWPMAIKGHPTTRVYRGEWGIDKAEWDSAKSVTKWQWEKRLFGDDKDLYIRLLVKPVPSYVDYMIYAYDEALKETELCGTYDDTGSPISVYDEELCLGYSAADGRKVCSSGLWIYRDRWKRAAALHARHGRPNYMGDSQHTQAHYQPAYGFIGLWMPCERGYYNHHLDRDNLDFYGSLERYYAYNPSHAFGQPGCAIGMGSMQTALDLLARDTRVMMMMALLHDQDVGTFGHRDPRTVYRLREVRNVFRQWEDDVSFTGFWAEPCPARAENPAFRVSLYRRPNSTLLIVGNTGEAGSSRIVPGWKALGLDVRTAQLGAPETGETIALKDGGFTVDLPRHGVRLVLAGDLSGYAWQPARDPGRDLPRPANALVELSDALRGPELDAGWTVDLHEGSSSVGFVDGRCYVQANHYGYGHIRRKLGVDNVSVQCMVLGKGVGGVDAYCGGMGLWWKGGAYVRVIPGGNKKKFYYETTGERPVYGREISTEAVPRWYPYFANGVKIQLTPEAIRFFVSTDGKTWEQDRELPRSDKTAGAPTWVVLGNGGATGDEPLFKNVTSRHFRPDHCNLVTVFTDFAVGE